MVELGPAVPGFAALLVQQGWTRSGMVGLVSGGTQPGVGCAKLCKFGPAWPRYLLVSDERG